MLTVTKIFEFEAAHFLPDYQGKCRQVHGHSYKLEVEVSGPPRKEAKSSDMVCDFSDLKNRVQRRILDLFDHQNLNNIIGYPTAENLLKFIVAKLIAWEFGKNLVRVRLWETSSCYAEWRKE